MLVILNANDSSKTVTIPTGDAFAVGTKLKSQLSDRELVVTINGIEDLELKCLSGLVLA